MRTLVQHVAAFVARSLPAAAAVALTATPCFAQKPPSSDQDRSTPEFPRLEEDRPALAIGDRVFTYNDFAAWLLRERGIAAVREFAFVAAIERRAAEIGVDLSDAGERAKVGADFDVRINNAFRGDRQAWLDELERLALSVDGVWAVRLAEERNVRLSTEVARHDWQVEERHIVREWEHRYGPGGRGITMRVLHLRFIPPPNPDGADIDAMTEIQNVARAALLEHAKEVRAGITTMAEFAETATRLSDHAATAAEGGLWPTIARREDWPPVVLDEVLAMPAGTISGPIVGKGGLWMFAIESVVETPIDTVREQLAADLRARGPSELDRADYLRELSDALEVRFPGAELDADPRALLRTGTIGVGDFEVPVSEFARWLTDSQGESYVDLFVSRVAIADIANERGITVTPTELAARVDRELVWMLENGFQGRKERWFARLQAAGETEASWRRDTARRLEPMLLAEKAIVASRVVTEDDARSFFIDRYGEEGERLDVRQIVVDLGIAPRDPLETDVQWGERVAPALEKLQPELDKIAARYSEGEDFAALVRTFSKDAASAVNGGRPPNGFDEQSLPEPVQFVLRSLPLGRMSAPQLVDNQIYFFEVVSRQKVDFESVKEALMSELRTRQPSAVDVALYFNVLSKGLPRKVLPGMWR